jgi:hypothetical protein
MSPATVPSIHFGHHAIDAARATASTRRTPTVWPASVLAQRPLNLQLESFEAENDPLRSCGVTRMACYPACIGSLDRTTTISLVATLNFASSHKSLLDVRQDVVPPHVLDEISSFQELSWLIAGPAK